MIKRIIIKSGERKTKLVKRKIRVKGIKKKEESAEIPTGEIVAG